MKEEDYDVWLHWYITYRCNLDCKYCLNKPKGITDMNISEVDVTSMIKMLDATKKIFKIGFTGGEPFLVPNIIEACEELTKKHYVSFNTNLTCQKIKEFAERIDPAKVSFIIASLHIDELERLNIVDRYISNFKYLLKKGFNMIADAVAYPEGVSKLDEYKKLFNKERINLKFSAFQGTYKGKKYPFSYTEEEMRIFNLNKEFIDIHYPEGKLCNAGYNFGIVDPEGNVFKCLHIKDKIGNIYENINFKEIGLCPLKFCECPPKYDKYLFEKAIKENKLDNKE